MCKTHQTVKLNAENQRSLQTPKYILSWGFVKSRSRAISMKCKLSNLFDIHQCCWDDYQFCEWSANQKHKSRSFEVDNKASYGIWRWVPNFNRSCPISVLFKAGTQEAFLWYILHSIWLLLMKLDYTLIELQFTNIVILSVLFFSGILFYIRSIIYNAHCYLSHLLTFIWKQFIWHQYSIQYLKLNKDIMT